MAERILNDENINALLSITVGALENPKQRADLITRLEGVRDDVQANGDDDALAFMNRLCQLAINGPTVIPEVKMPSAYRAPWNALVAHIQSSALPDGQDMFTTIRTNTLLVMTEAPQHKQDWFDNVSLNFERAKAQEDTQMVTLLSAIRNLLLDGTPSTMSPQLEGEHKACWQAIVKGLE